MATLTPLVVSLSLLLSIIPTHSAVFNIHPAISQLSSLEIKARLKRKVANGKERLLKTKAILAKAKSLANALTKTLAWMRKNNWRRKETNTKVEDRGG